MSYSNSSNAGVLTIKLFSDVETIEHLWVPTYTSNDPYGLIVAAVIVI